MKERFISFGLSAAVIAANLACDPAPSHKNTNATPTRITREVPTQTIPEPRPPLPQLGEQLKRSVVAETVRTFEDEAGKRILTFQEASKFAPLITQLYRESTDSPIITEALEKQIFILEGTRQTRVEREQLSLNELEELPVIKTLRENYPGVSFSEEELRRIVRSRRAGGFVVESRIFINLDEANGKSVTTPTYPDFPQSQYFNIALDTSCAPLGPATALRKTLVHELAHRDVYKERSEIDPEIVGMFRRVAPQQWTVQMEPIQQYGFGIEAMATYPDGTTQQQPVELYEEIGADYIAAAISVVNGLGFTGSDYSNPSSLYNFQQMLIQAQISDQSFVLMHRDYDLKMLLRRLGEAGLVENPSGADPLELAFTLANRGIATLNNDWLPVLSYFPTTTLRPYRCI